MQRQKEVQFLRESRQLRAMIDAIPDLVFVYDLAANRDVYANGGIARHLGYTREQTRSMGPAFLVERIHPDDLPAVTARLAHLEDANEEDVSNLEFRMQNAGGEWRWFHSRVTVLARDKDGRPQQILGTAQDVTGRKWLEEQAALQIASARQANAELERQREELARMNVQLERLAATDGLTGLKNHRAFEERLHEEWERAVRYHTQLSMILLDVDDFKRFNDTFGHPAGDEVLKSVARILQETARGVDLIARYGGEEFVVLLPETSAQGSRESAERIRDAIENAAWPLRPITVSLGVASRSAELTDRAVLLEQADRALYRSKQTGKNRVTHSLDIADAL